MMNGFPGFTRDFEVARPSRPRGTRPTRRNTGGTPVPRFAWTVLVLFAACPAVAVDVTIDLSKKHQTIDGFGTSLISWDPQFTRMYQSHQFQKTYLEEVGCNMLRVEFSGTVSPRPIEKVEDIRYQDFVMRGPFDRPQVYLDFASGLSKKSKEFKVVGSVWTPPAWMKENNNLVDPKRDEWKKMELSNNRLRADRYEHFAKWLAEWVKLYQSRGITVTAVSPQNEPLFSQYFESCIYTPEEYAKMLKAVGDRFEKEGLTKAGVKLFGPEHMTFDLWHNGKLIEAMEKEGSLKYLKLYASHGYIDGFTADRSKDSSAQLWKSIEKYEIPYWMTEGGTGSHDWPAALTDIGAMLHNSLVYGNASAIFPWQITDPQPNEHGLMVFGRMTKKTRVAQHYFRFIPPGAVRIDAITTATTVAVSAFYHSEKQRLVIILTNPTEEDLSVRFMIVGGETKGSLTVWRTSAAEDLVEAEKVAPADQSWSVKLTSKSIVTIVIR